MDNEAPKISAHERAINSLIHVAAVEAECTVCRDDYENMKDYKIAWDLVYLGAMNRLTSAAGLRGVVK